MHKLRKNIAKDGTINNKALASKLSSFGGGEGFNILGFGLGFILGPIGVLISYLMGGDDRSNRTKWAWKGFGAAILLSLIIITILLKGRSYNSRTGIS